MSRDRSSLPFVQRDLKGVEGVAGEDGRDEGGEESEIDIVQDSKVGSGGRNDALGNYST